MTSNFLDAQNNLLILGFVYVLLPLVAILALYFGWIRPRRNKQVAKNENQAAASTGSALEQLRAFSGSEASDADEDLPDLDLLLAESAPNEPRTLSDRVRVRLDSGEEIEAEEVALILRDSQGLLVQIGATAYRNLSNEPNVRRQFTRTLKDLSSVVIGTGSLQQAAPPTPKPAPPTESKATASAPETPPQPSEPKAAPVPEESPMHEPRSEAKPAETTKPPAQQASGPLPGDLPSYRYDDNPVQIAQRGIRGPRVEFTPPPEMNIADAIESYLQYKLAQGSEYAGHKLHIRSAPDGGVRIQVGETFYESIDDIEDEGVRNFLRSTIDEWQSRQ